MKSSGKQKKPKVFQNRLCFHVYNVEGQQSLAVRSRVLIIYVDGKLIAANMTSLVTPPYSTEFIWNIHNSLLKCSLL